MTDVALIASHPVIDQTQDHEEVYPQEEVSERKV